MARLQPKDYHLKSLVGFGLTPALYYNTLAALVSQHGPIENKFQDCGLITRFVTCGEYFRSRPFQTTNETYL